jgi:hypothetical protein
MATLASADAALDGTAGWPHARLIPTYGIRSQDEQEKRATACLLAVMHGVPEFGHALLGELGAPRSPNVETFAEVRFKNAEGKTDIPDGVISCERGAKRWTCLVEVKTGTAVLKDDQVGRYLDIARDDGVGMHTEICGASPPRMQSGLHLTRLSWRDTRLTTLRSMRTQVSCAASSRTARC